MSIICELCPFVRKPRTAANEFRQVANRFEKLSDKERRIINMASEALFNNNPQPFDENTKIVSAAHERMTIYEKHYREASKHASDLTIRANNVRDNCGLRDAVQAALDRANGTNPDACGSKAKVK